MKAYNEAVHVPQSMHPFAAICGPPGKKGIELYRDIRQGIQNNLFRRKPCSMAFPQIAQVIIILGMAPPH
jgi:hypothetical protein